ncbi:MAG: ABC transporter substrate-binding protein [Chloroflexi bacterium]|nr:ABC transporter substrate-binding protein [Chloroflexota bacterium]
MNKQRTFLCLILALLGLAIVAMACKPQFQPGTFTDDAGRAVTINKAPQRLVSHVPSITEMLFAIGLGDKVVGVSDWDKYPPEAKSKPSVGDYFKPSVERIVAQDPDLVLTDGYSKDLPRQLDSLKINYAVINPKDVDGIFRDIDLIGKMTGSEVAAQKLVQSMKDDMADVVSNVKGAPRVKVFYVIDAKTDPNNPWTAGPGSIHDYLITTAGGSNIAATAVGDYVQLSIEAIVAANPDIIVIADYPGSTIATSIEAFKQHPVWSRTRAVQNERVFMFNSDLSNPTPRIAQGLREMAKILHPDLVK